MAAFDQYLKSVPKILFRNVTDKTIPAYGVMILWTLNKRGEFQALYGPSEGHKHGGEYAGYSEEAEIFAWDTGTRQADGLFNPGHQQTTQHHEPDEISRLSHEPYEVNVPYAEESGDDDIHRISGGKLTLNISTEWASAFNLGNAVEPGNRGYCYNCFPAIVPVYDPSVKLHYGDIVAIKKGEFKVSHAHVPGGSSNYAAVLKTDPVWIGRSQLNGWPFMSKVPNTEDLIVIGGVPSYEHLYDVAGSWDEFA